MIILIEIVNVRFTDVYDTVQIFEWVSEKAFEKCFSSLKLICGSVFHGENSRKLIILYYCTEFS